MSKSSRVVAGFLLLASFAGRAAGSDAADGASFDGRWWVELACADTQDRNGPVKG